MSDEVVLTITVRRSGARTFLARADTTWPFEDGARAWSPSALQRAETAVEAAELALGHVRRIGTHRKRGRKPSGYAVARQLANRFPKPAK